MSTSTPPPVSSTVNPPPSTATSSFPFPPEYSFPPFFTRQTNLTTHHAQLTKWAALVLAYCRHHRIFKLSLSGSGTTTGSTAAAAASMQHKEQTELDTTELFYNRHINRRLSLADIKEVIEFLRKDGRAEYYAGGGGNNSSSDGGGARGEEEMWWSVLTVYELVEGDGTLGEEFHGLDQELLLKALNVLVKRGKAQVFGQEDSRGVKFF
ncbi:Vacuolar protein-sorting-associated protein 25 [Madurella mycetomatis]|uniref:Vacuolar protein-sorting-associated protein 25 n=1 Tax=Madurella mycetomatis TaxID=100816 RepID=A0A150ASC9_9PEZI|nr:Vacuolar protein-sorting-associated protein 25 [Madurella mycetomatis]